MPKDSLLPETRWRISEWCAAEMWWYISSTSAPATRRCPVSAARSWMPWQRMRTAGLYWISPTRHAGRWVCTAEAWAWPGLRGWDSCRRRSFSEAMPSRRKWMGVSFISSPWYRRGLSIYSEAVMWPGSWFRCWPMWDLDAWSWMTGRHLPIPGCFPRQRGPSWGIWNISAIMWISVPETMCAS